MVDKIYINCQYCLVDVKQDVGCQYIESISHHRHRMPGVTQKIVILTSRGNADTSEDSKCPMTTGKLQHATANPPECGCPVDNISDKGGLQCGE